ncbi:hypothetical protein CHS0354_042474 [Potamilus streckersoni]|uniref:Tetraspanin n=1 Tax=Potamilus streckersoni TaxID=2493646 RepID=A0AAE0S9Q0_9BIVA|nr:hypothetical protein CHS0354_042474 [Potamilus streckersoni]
MRKLARIAGIGRLIVVLLNIIFLAAGFGFFISGVVIRFGSGSYKTELKPIEDSIETSLMKSGFGSKDINVDLGPILQPVALILIGFGVLIIVMCFLGCCGSCHKIHSLLIVYAVAVIILLLEEITLLIILFGVPSLIQNPLRNILKADVRSNYKGFNGTDNLSMTWNVVMQKSKCCGVDSYTDFTGATGWVVNYSYVGSGYILKTPLACCRTLPSGTDFSCADNKTATDTNNYMNTGCFKVVWAILFGNVGLYAGVFAALAVIQIALVLFAFTVFCWERSNKIDPAMEETEKVDASMEETEKGDIAKEKNEKVDIAMEETDEVDISMGETDKVCIAKKKSDKVDITKDETENIVISMEKNNNVDMAKEKTEKVNISMEKTCKVDIAKEKSDKIDIAKDEIEKADISMKKTYKVDIAKEESEKVDITIKETGKVDISMEKNEKVKECGGKVEIAKWETEKIEIAREETEKVDIAREETEKVDIDLAETDKVDMAKRESDEVEIANDETEKVDKINIALEETNKVDIAMEETDVETEQEELLNTENNLVGSTQKLTSDSPSQLELL